MPAEHPKEVTERILIFVCGIVAGLLIGLFLVEDAEAINRDQLPAMHQVAVGYFGPVACGQVAYTFVSAASLQGDDAPLGALARGGGCNTRLSAEFFDAASWGDACKVVVHEYGHSVQDDMQPDVEGVQPHSADRNSIMHADSDIRFAPCEQADPTLALEDRCYRLEERRWKTSDRTLDARRALRRLVARHAQTDRVYRAHRRVRHWRKAYENARAEHRSCLAELRTYGVEV